MKVPHKLGGVPKKKMRAKLLQPENALSAIVVTLAGILIPVKPLQPKNAKSPMLVTVLGRVIEPVLPCGHWLRYLWALS